VLADHDHKSLTPSTLSVVTAATKIGGTVNVLVAGKGAQTVADAAKGVAGVSKVLHADNEKYAHSMPEGLTQLVRQNSLLMQFEFMVSVVN
jgi:electron transfer flavoprotein alpha subunit